MIETQIREPVASAVPSGALGALPHRAARLALTVSGSVLIAVNVALRLAGGGGEAIPVVLWGSAAACFIASFILLMSEAQPSQADAPAKKGAEPSATAASKPIGDPVAKSLTTADPDPAAQEPKGPALIPHGNRLRLLRGGVPALLASICALILMGHEGQLRWGVPLGILLVATVCFGVMDLLGTFDDADDRVVASHRLAEVGRPLLGLAAGSLLFCLALGFASAGAGLPPPAWGVLVTLTFVGAVAGLFASGRALGVWKLDEEGLDRPLLKRHGFWLVVFAAALLFPLMGASSLWDPWETHYGEVSREILAKDDWISLWWAQDGWFWSKPVLDMWMQAIAMATLGVHYQPGKMLIGTGTQPILHPEWAVRAPVVLLTILALYLLYRGSVKTLGRRAAFLGGIVLATTPDFYFLAHQTMTDMPFVAAMIASIGLVLLGMGTPEAELARAYEVVLPGKTRVRLRFTGWHLTFFTILICTLPQILYLLSRNVGFIWRPGAHGFLPRWDEFRSGSGMGNCGLPGNEDCHISQPASIPRSATGPLNSIGAMIWRAVGAFEPGIQAAMWTAMLGLVLYLSWGERRVRRLYYLAAWFFAAISTLGKGPAGVALPMLVTFAYLAASRPAEDLVTRTLRTIRELCQLEIVAGLLIIGMVALPWYIAMYVRHGPPFTDRLIFHDMFNRAFHHVHDTNEGDDTSFRFYVWQLGYALFPWTALAPLGLTWWLRRGSSEKDGERADTCILFALWFVFAFALFSFMGTKFHHYIFPAVPAVAMLIGVVLDDMLGKRPMAELRVLPAYLLGLLIGVSMMVLGIARLQPGSIFGAKVNGNLANPSTTLGIGLLALGGIVVAMVVIYFRTKEADPLGRDDDEETAHISRVLAAGAITGAAVLLVVARDLALRPEGSDQPGAIRLLQLFTYNYKRAWPDSLDFSAALMAFGVVGAIATAGLAVRAVRQHAVAAMCALAFAWGIWGLDVYMQRTAQHWGQHEIIEAYYANRQSPNEKLIAYQMNWKGENFYTGNDIPAFVSTGSTFTNWMKKKREEGVKVMYFITEHGRLGGLKSEVGAKTYREITDKVLCNKFILVRAEL
jgi:4-amino-4-deoxy-L-arabinose transferase-like glycosyltransferase